MKPEQAHIDQIRTSFEKMKSREDLLNLLNNAKPMVYGEKAVPFELKQLTWYANPNLGKKRYTEFKIRKKSGSERTIHAPVRGLKSLQKVLSFVLQCVYEPHNAAMGFVRDKSIVDNAKIHVSSKYIYNIDLKDFFPSVDQARVWKCLQLKPFNLLDGNFPKEEFENINNPHELKQEDRNMSIFSGSNLLFPELNKKLRFKRKDPVKLSRTNIASLIASLCCTEIEVERKTESGEWEKVKRNVLPQGAPTSPVITNIVCQRLDYLLSGVAKRFGLKYSRYADDITFSSMHNVYKPESDFLKELHRIIAEQGFHIKESKTRLQKDGYRKEVTGLLVNEKANVQQRYIKQLRMWLYYWERYGYERASGFFLQHYIADKGHVKNGKPDMVNVISGKLDYLKMVKGADNESYLKLKARINKLIKPVIQESNYTKLEEVNVNAEKLSNLENGHYKIKTNKGTSYLIEIVRNNVTVIDDAGRGFEATTSFFNDFYKFDISLPDGWIIFKVPSQLNITSSNEVLKVDEELNLDVVFDNTQADSEAEVEKNDLIIPIFHNPKELVALLKNFSVNDSALKYTTHSWDAGRDANMFKDLSEFLEIAKSQYSEFSFALKGLSENLNGKIYNFLFNKEIAKSGWGDINPKKRIYFGWSSPELLEACNNDISLNPEDFILPEKFQIQRAGKTLQKFKHIIDVFKNEIEVRDENSALYNLIIQKHDNYLISFSAPEVSNLENKTFYTDIQWLSKALDLIFKGIQDRPQHQEVEYYVTENNSEKLSLNILHKNSLKKGVTIHDEKLNLTRGDFGPIKNYLMNLCDWSIESEFAEGAYRINYLVSDREIPAYEKIVSAEGFKHILTFYK